MTNRESIITEIKNFITGQIENMTYDEYENLCYCGGLLSIRDDAVRNAISVYRKLIPDGQQIVDEFDSETWKDILRHFNKHLSIFIYHNGISGYKCFRLNSQTGELLDECDYYNYFRQQAIDMFCFEFDCDESKVVIHPIKNK